MEVIAVDDPHIPPIGRQVLLKDWNPAGNGEFDKDRAVETMAALRVRLNELQDLLYADGRFAVLVVLQGIDTAGKDGTIRSVFEQVGPLGCSVENFGVPSAEELSHDFLWRYHLRAPRRGHIVIFNRSHYEAVLVERVKHIVPPSVWASRFDQINRFEEMLAAESTIILKFYLHISRDEQRERLQERVDNPLKRWKFRAGDLDDRKLWGDYQLAFEEMLTRCNTHTAPWYVVPADRKWYRDIVVAQALVAKLESLGLRYPDPDPAIVNVKVK